MFRFVLPAILALTLPVLAAPAELGQLDASPALFTVLAAINACGYDADLASPNNVQLRHDIRAEIAKRDIPSLPALKAYFQKHRRRDGDAAELGQYISFAVNTDGPPAFKFKKKDIDLAPDAAAMADFTPLIAAFYKEANIDDLWKRSQRAIDQYVGLYHTAVADTVLQSNVYLRQQTSGFRGRRFQIFLELLAAPNQVHARSYDDEYVMVVTPSPELRIADIRRGYLHYILDPLSLRYREILERKKPIGDHAKRAMALPEGVREDFGRLVTESLIRAVEARMDHRPADVEQALREGFILAPFFNEQLAVYEKQEAAMILYYPQLVGAIDLYKEDKRLAEIQFDSKIAPRTVKVAPPPEAPALTGAAKTLDDAEKLYLDRKLDDAKKLFLDALQQTDQKPMHAAAYYGLARIAIFEKDPETADRLFRKSLELGPEAPVKAWDLVYLGKLSVAAGEREPAVEFFQDALRVEGASPKAREEAQKSLQQAKQ